MAFENSVAPYRPLDDLSVQAPRLAWQPSSTDYQSYSGSTSQNQLDANQMLIQDGLLNDLQFSYGSSDQPFLEAKQQEQQGYVSKSTPDLDALDPSQLSSDAQFGGAAGNWFRYLGRAMWHNIEGMAKPGAADNMIFGSLVTAKHYYAENSLQTVFNDVNKLGRDAQRALWHVPELTDAERSKASAELVCNAFFFVGAKAPMAVETAEQMGLRAMSAEQLARLGIERDVPMMFNGERMALTGVEVTRATGDELNSIWTKGWSVRGFEGEQQMGVSGILSKNFPRIDDAIFKDGVFTSMKTVDLNAVTYQSMERLEKRLESCLDKLDTWHGQEKLWGNQRVDSSQIQEKVLQIGIPNGSMTTEQAAVFEKLGQEAQSKGIKLIVTAIE